VPASGVLEKAFFPSSETIAARIESMLAKRQHLA
jgi:hypothetical protein